jgi:uncharacterized protein YjbI with pentapeptide repeats
VEAGSMICRSRVSLPYAAWTHIALLVTAAGCLDPQQQQQQQPAPERPAPPAAVEVNTAAVRGLNLSGLNLSAMNLSAMNLSAMNLSGMNMGGTNLSGMNLSGMNFGGTNFGGNNLGALNMAASNLSGMNLSGMNLSGMNLSGMNLGASNLSGMNMGASNLSGMNLSGMNLSGMNLAGADSGRNIHGLGGSMTGMLYSGEDLVSPKDDQCIVMGIGSTAFARLIAQQSANARLSVALGRLPWGFAASPGGPTTLDAWEAVVWGDQTYCTFVISAPPDSSWTGVAGFIKAIFRWNAPLSQSIDISGIDASAPHDPSLVTEVISYTGMMNAAARYVAGTIDEVAFIAGELAFITATTNNQTVMVDFSSWVRDSSGNALVLGNVESVNPPTFAESVYFVYQNPDGTFGVSVSKADAAPGVTSSYNDLASAYVAYRAGLSPKPLPIRCGGALYLATGGYGEPMLPGKCDSGLTLTAVEGAYPTGMKAWSTVPGTTAPMNQAMYLPSTAAEPYLRSAGKPILSETYIFMWEPSHVFAGSPVGSFDSGDRAALGVAVASSAACATGQEADKAFDQQNNKFWCGTGTPSSSSPRSLMYMWGASVPINSYRLTSADITSRDPMNWLFQGCSGSCTVGSDSGWVNLDVRTSQLFDTRLQTKTYTFSNSVAYRQYRLRITHNRGGVSGVQLAEVDLLSSGAVVPLTGVDRTENGIVAWQGSPCSTGEQATRAFDNLLAANGATRWCVSNAPSATRPISISYSWSSGQVIKSYAITSASDTPTRDPKGWTLQGCSGTCQLSVDSQWTTLDTRTSETFATRNLTKTYPIANNTPYTSYRLQVTANNGDTKLQMGEIQLFQ